MSLGQRGPGDGYDRLFERPVCIFYEHDPTRKGSDKERCRCGYTKAEHLYTKFKSQTIAYWDPLSCLIVPALPNRKRLEGKIKFNNVDGDSDTRLSRFITLGNEADASLAIEYLAESWGLRTPKLIVSILGGQESSRIDPMQKERIKDGILKAVSTTESWMVTDGGQQGITKVLGDAVRQAETRQWSNQGASTVTMVGINTWGCIDGHEAIDQHFYSSQSHEPHEYRLRQRKVDASTCPLNPNHSYFIFIDNGMKGEPRAETQFRQQFEAGLSHHGLKPSEKGNAIPLVQVVLGGSLYAFQSVAKSVEKGVPVVLADGVGGASEIILFALKFAILREGTGKILPAEKITALKKLTRQVVCLPINQIESMTETQIDDWLDNTVMKYVNFLLNFEHLMTDYKVGKSGSQELDAAILHALLKGDVARKYYDPLDLALAWDRADVAARDVLADEMHLPQRNNINKMMLKAIMEGKIEFVKLFMERGFFMQEFLIEKRLELLYNYAAHTNGVLSYLLKKSTKESTTGSYSLKQVSRLIKQLTQMRHGASNDNSVVKSRGPLADQLRTFDDPFAKLCFWAILANKMELSLFFWSRSKESIMVALIASQLWKALAERLWPGEDVLQPEFEENAEAYHERAVGVVDVCYRTDHDLARNLVNQSSTIWPGRNRMDVALLGNCKTFLATACVQAVVDSDWKGGLRCSFLKILLCLVWPPALRNLSMVVEDDKGKQEKGSNHSLSSASKSKSSRRDSKYGSHAKLSDEQQNLLESRDEPYSNESKSQYENGTNYDPKKKKLTFRLPDPKGDQHKSKISFWRRVKTFYRAPVTKFTTHSMAYLAFLFLYSFMVLQLTNENPEHHLEIYVIIIAFAYILEEIRQLVAEDAKWLDKLAGYLDSEWNIIDISYLSMVFLAFILGRGFGLYEPSRILYGLVTLLLWMRVIRLYQAVDRLGPLWIMMRKMFKEMMIFITVLVVFLLAYGVCTVTLIFEPTALEEAGLLSTAEFVVVIPALQMFGELFLDTLVVQRGEQLVARKEYYESFRNPPPPAGLLGGLSQTGMDTPYNFSTTCNVLSYSLNNITIVTDVDNTVYTWNGTRLALDIPTLPPPFNGTIPKFETFMVTNPTQATLANWLLAAYLLIGNVLILNLLIAIFGHIYEVVQENSTIEWKNEMFLLCQEFMAKTIMPPPLSVFELIFNVIRSFCKKEKNDETDEQEMQRLRIFESYCASKYRAERAARKTLDQNIQLLVQHAETENERITDLIEIVENLRQDLEPQGKLKMRQFQAYQQAQ